MIWESASVYVSSCSRQQGSKSGGESDLHPRLVVYTMTLNRSLGLRTLEALVLGGVPSRSPLTFLVSELIDLVSEIQDKIGYWVVRK